MPPLISQPMPAEEQVDTFVGRAQELGEFRKSVRYLLGHEQPTVGTDYPHMFLVSGEGGMGKSALLHQFEKIAQQEGMPNAQMIKLDLEYQQFLTTETLAQALVQIVRQKHSDFAHHYRLLQAQREALLPRYNKLRKQWTSWEALRGSTDEKIEDMEHKYRQLWNKSEEQRAHFGTLYEPIHLITQSENALEALAAIQDFRNTQGHTPQSFDELLQSQLGEGADVFLKADAIAQAFSKDLYDLAEKVPILLVIDTYEKVEQHDDWIRNDLLSNSNSRMLTIMAGRNPFKKYGQKFRHFVRSYNLNNLLLQPNEIQEYLKLKLGQTPPASLVDQVYAMSQGVPVALEALENELSNVGSLNVYQDLDFIKLDQRLVVPTLLNRFLSYALDSDQDTPHIRAEKQRDVHRIQAFALLLRPDAKLLCILWDLPFEEARQAIRELNVQYSFIFADYSGDYIMHALVRKCVRRHVFEHRRGSFDWPVLEAGLRRLDPVLKDRIAKIEQYIIDIDARYTSAEWRRAVLDMLNVLLWLGEHQHACQLMLNCWIGAQYASISFADEIISLANEFVTKTLYLPELLGALRTGEIFRHIPKNFVSMIEPQAHAVLAFLRAQSMRIDTITTHTLEQYQHYIGGLEQSYELDRSWMPAQAELAKAYRTLGHYYLYQQANNNAALRAYDRALQLQPDDPLIFKHRGVAKHNLQDLTGALVDFEVALAMRPRDPSVFLNRGQTKRLHGDPQGALADFDRAVAERPDDPNILLVRADLREECGDFEQARADRDLAARVFHQRGIGKRKQGDAVGALSDLTQALMFRPADPDILLSRAHARFLSRNPVEALADLDQALQLRPNHENTLYNRGFVRITVGNLVGALEDFEAVHLRVPRDARPIYRAARIYALQDQSDRAIERLGQVIALESAFRTLARDQPDFASLREDPRFVQLVS